MDDCSLDIISLLSLRDISADITLIGRTAWGIPTLTKLSNEDADETATGAIGDPGCSGQRISSVAIIGLTTNPALFITDGDFKTCLFSSGLRYLMSWYDARIGICTDIEDIQD